MAKGILEFDLEEPDDRREFYMHNKALDMALAFWDLNNLVRELDNEELTEKYWAIMEERDIDVDKMII